MLVFDVLKVVRVRVEIGMYLCIYLLMYAATLYCLSDTAMLSMLGLLCADKQAFYFSMIFLSSPMVGPKIFFARSYSSTG